MGQHTDSQKKMDWKRKYIGCGVSFRKDYKNPFQNNYNGKIYAVDNDSNMIKKATENLGVVENVKLVQTDLLNIESANMPIKLDAIFSMPFCTGYGPL